MLSSKSLSKFFVVRQKVPAQEQNRPAKSQVITSTV